MKMEEYDFVIYEEFRETGCVMEDGADTRKSKRKTLLIPKHQEEQYLEDCAEEYGSQDYSYKFDTNKVAELSYHQILEIAHKLIMALEIHDVVNDKEKYKQIAEKLNHCFDYLKKEGEKE
jgi:hypothetical protein